MAIPNASNQQGTQILLLSTSQKHNRAIARVGEKTADCVDLQLSRTFGTFLLTGSVALTLIHAHVVTKCFQPSSYSTYNFSFCILPIISLSIVCGFSQSTAYNLSLCTAYSLPLYRSRLPLCAACGLSFCLPTDSSSVLLSTSLSVCLWSPSISHSVICSIPLILSPLSDWL